MYIIWLKFILGEGGKHQVMLTHGHAIELLIPICEKVKNMYRDHSYHPNYLWVVLLYQFTLHNNIMIEKRCDTEDKDITMTQILHTSPWIHLANCISLGIIIIFFT